MPHNITLVQVLNFTQLTPRTSSASAPAIEPHILENRECDTMPSAAENDSNAPPDFNQHGSTGALD